MKKQPLFSRLQDELSRLSTDPGFIFGIFHTGKSKLATKFCSLTTRQTIVFGTNFPFLYKVKKKLGKNNTDKASIIEISSNDFPFRPKCFDCIFVSAGLPEALPHYKYLRILLTLIKPEGIVLWLHPHRHTLKTLTGCFSRRNNKINPIKRTEMSKLMMKAGFKNIGQITSKSRYSPLVVTTGKVGKRPWDKD